MTNKLNKVENYPNTAKVQDHSKNSDTLREDVFDFLNAWH